MSSPFAILLVILVVRVSAGVRRVGLTLALAVVLSAIELDARPRLSQPAPVVLRITEPPPLFGRARPYRAHHRYAQPGSSVRW